MRRSDPVALTWREGTPDVDGRRPTVRTLNTWAEPITAALAAHRGIDRTVETVAGTVLRIAAPLAGSPALGLADRAHLSSLRVEWRGVERAVTAVEDPDGRRRWLDLHLV